MSKVKKIEETLSRSVCGGWDRDFLVSVLSQLTKGATLSVKQRQTLGKVLARNTAEAEAEHANWAIKYDQEYKVQAKILANYHLHQPYYRELSRDILAGRAPERSKFLRMYDNKYSKRVLREHSRAPRYDVGEYLVPRAAFNSYKNIEFVGDMIWIQQNKIINSFQKRGGFVMDIMPEIRSAAKGAKRYKLLPVGVTTPIIVEERFLKVGKKKK